VIQKLDSGSLTRIYQSWGDVDDGRVESVRLSTMGEPKNRLWGIQETVDVGSVQSVFSQLLTDTSVGRALGFLFMLVSIFTPCSLITTVLTYSSFSLSSRL
jgi:hypothetical protein